MIKGARIIDVITRDGMLHHAENITDYFLNDSNNLFLIERVTDSKIKCIDIYSIDFIQSIEIYDITANN